MARLVSDGNRVSCHGNRVCCHGYRVCCHGYRVCCRGYRVSYHEYHVIVFYNSVSPLTVSEKELMTTTAMTEI